MENLEISKVEKKQAATGTGATGFNFFDEEDSYSEPAEDECDYEHIEVDYIGKLRVQRERVVFWLCIDGEIGKVLLGKRTATWKGSGKNKSTSLRG